MYTEPNLLRRRDREGLAFVERMFHEGPVADALDGVAAIERRRSLTAEQFAAEYRAAARPVVLEGYAADWPAVRNWTFEGLAARCGDVPVVIDSYNSQAARRATFAEFVTQLRGNTRPGAVPIYLQEWYYQASAPELAPEMPELDIAQYDFRHNLYGEQAATNHQLWLGQRGGITRLHQDSYMVDVLHVQIVGAKRWCVMGADAQLRTADEAGLKELVDSPATQLMQCVLEPGDVLFLPAMWYHRIELLSDSIGLGRKCLDEANLRLHIRQRMAELLALALNADEVKQTHPELFDVVIARNRVWAKRMGIDLSKLRP